MSVQQHRSGSGGDTDTATLLADGSSTKDAPDRVLVDRRREPFRWICPNGHTSWSPTNNHLWCTQCRRNYEAGEDVDPEHYHIVDKRSGRKIPWSAVEIVDSGP